MTEQNSWDKKITAAVDAASVHIGVLSPAAVCRRIKKKTRALRQQYLRVGNNTQHTPWEEWLCDNYYVLEKESKQAVKDIRLLSMQAEPGEITSFYGLFYQVLNNEMPPISDESIAALVRAASGCRAVSEKQFSCIPAATKGVLVEIAYAACFEEQSEERMSYSITGLGRLGAVDMDDIIETCSSIESVLLQDPAGIYPAMSSESRQQYRHLIAQIAAKKKEPEAKVARDMLTLCQNQEGIRAHLGYHILRSHHVTACRRSRGKASIALGVLLPLLLAVGLGLFCRSLWIAVLTYLPLWEILRTPIQQVAMSGVDVDFIPRMNLKKVKNKPKTVVLVSTLLPKAKDAPELSRRLEQLYFSNSDPDMYYCILADMAEWPFPTDEKDESQIAAVKKVIEALNRRHGEHFMLFLRARTYNKTQKKYCGWERKRGAITEFVRFLKGERVSLHTFVGDRRVLPQIKFIIALDADTNLLYESAQTLVSAAIHPLNRPEANGEGVVTSGYGVLVPKTSADLDSARQTAFSRVMTGCGGVTAYDTKDKDFYQDLFGEGIFAGKGLLDVDCFYRLLNDRFPENQVLSHDILEGAYLRVGFISDAEMTDSAPRTMLSWLSRLHRWMRGDWQNIKFIGSRYKAEGKAYSNPISNLSKYKLFDNLRRSLTPLAALLCVVAAVFTPPPESWILALCGVLAVTFASLWAAVWALLTGGTFTLSRKFFTRTLPHTLELITQGALFLVMLPAQALITADAALRALWRTFVSHKKMLEWQTAAQGDSRAVNLKALANRLWLPELFGIAYSLYVWPSELCLLGLIFALAMPVAWYSARPSADIKGSLKAGERDTLISYNAAMWRYYEDFANRSNHYLPPDNVQQSPVFRVATRTSPTNIGMMLLSVLAARDLDLIDTAGLYTRVDRTLATVERLAKWNGNLYNWYDTATLDTLKPEFVSTVDSGNFVCCLVALAQGLRELVVEKPEFLSLIGRIDTLVEATDLAVFYNKKKRLFSIGYDVGEDGLVGSHYDFLMSEARLTSYYAVARKIVDKRHWGSLGRTMSRSGSYAGAVSWTGTMFEYFMPHLLLPVYEGSLLSEGLVYCLYCHKRRVKGLDVPWGISESAFYAYDNNLNYQYKAHGVQKLGVKRYLDRDLVISPYSTFITIPMNPHSSMENLRNLRDLGVYGHYGFYEAVDFTSRRVGKSSLAVTRSYMAHHIGMSMVSSSNALFENKMQKRFMRDNYMRSAREFLQEKLAKNTVVYDDLTQAGEKGEKHERHTIQTEESAAIYPQSPRCMVLTNSELTDVLTDTGAGYLKFGDVDLTRRSGDLLRRAQGILALVHMGGRTIPAAMAPFYDRSTSYRVEVQEQGVTYYAEQKDVEIGLRCMIHPTISCQQRQIVIKNTSSQKQMARVLFYFEPILGKYQDYSAHPAYSKLFVQAVYDESAKTITFSRRGRDCTVDMYLTVGFLQDIDFSFETRREALQSAPEGMDGLLRFAEKSFSDNGGGVPDACCAMKFDLMVNAGAQAQATLLLCASRTKSEGVESIISMRGIGLLGPKTAARSPLLGDSLEGRLCGSVLGQLLYSGGGNCAAKERNRLGQSALWVTGISGDLPIALLELKDDFDAAMLESYLRLHRILRSLQVEFDLCILYSGQGETLRGRVLALVEKNSVGGLLGSRGGVFVLERDFLAPETLTLLHAVARHTVADTLGADGTQPPAPYYPVRISPVSPAELPKDAELMVDGGVFSGGRFYVDRTSPLPYSHVLANPVFGTLVSDSALGYTWAVNSRENKLTPWYNDICTDNTGEMLLLYDGDSYLNLIHGARASFSSADACYAGKASRLETHVKVTVSAKGCAKYMDVTLRSTGKRPHAFQCAYYTEPVLGVTRDTAGHIRPELTARGQTLVLQNTYNTAVRSCAAVTVRGAEEVCFLTRREQFLRGDWQGGVSPEHDLCAAVIVDLSLEPGEEKTLRFVLGYGATPESAARMVALELPARLPGENSVVINTPDEGINQYVSHFALHQILASRLWGRTAFYQCGGAYGFRDQLQDACACLLLDSKTAKRQIVRCCGVQFEQGDVLHWWHQLPGSGGGLKGVRTRFSDDLLWLPYVAAEYVEQTGDASLLDIRVAYISAPELSEHEHEKYISPQRSALGQPVYDHCIRAIERSWQLDERGLPLIGCGDWNDGFSAVGKEGRGSSVWLAMFLSIVLERFAPLCAARGDEALAAELSERAESLRQAVDRHCWDGEWYIRAFFDSGEKMGSIQNTECVIDLLPQSFAVLCGMPDKGRVEQGLHHAWERLVDKQIKVVKLFAPPFQESHQQPGYVKAYPPGIRENGGQYTHGAIWFALALLQAGKAGEGVEILSMLSPANRCTNPVLSRQYKLEPYYMAADIYTNPNAPGRGGWSMYTGAASWYFRVVVESLLGIRKRGNHLELNPHMPQNWQGASARLVLDGTSVSIQFHNSGENRLLCDGEPMEHVPLDGGAHQVEVHW